MKILLISNSFAKRIGDKRYIIELAKYFTKEHEVHLLTSVSDPFLDEYGKISNLTIHKKRNIKNPYWLQMLANAFLNEIYAKRLKKELKLDIIHSNTWESFFCDVLVMHSCYRMWLKIANQILEEESSHLKYLLYSARRWLLPKNRVFLGVEKRVLRQGSKKIIVASEVFKKGVLENYDVPEEKITVIPFGVDTGEFKPDLKKRIEIRKKYGINEKDIVFMLSGYEFKRKGLKYVIEALSSIKGRVKIFAVGEEDPQKYKELAARLKVSDKIIFTGFVPEIKDYYAASDVYIFPTTYEPFGIVTLEAMATGLPIIISKVAGSSEVIKDGCEGFLLDDHTNPKEIAEKINILANNDLLRKQMGESALKTARKYTWEETARKTLEVYKESLIKDN